MKILTGIDIVDINEFKNSIKNGGPNFLKKVFLDDELKNNNTIHLAGVFAAKEAVLKALSIEIDSLKKIKIEYKKDGRPYVVLNEGLSIFDIKSSDLSISHSLNSAVAIFVALI